jgi:hypothetical protein
VNLSSYLPFQFPSFVSQTGGKIVLLQKVILTLQVF